MGEYEMCEKEAIVNDLPICPLQQEEDLKGPIYDLYPPNMKSASQLALCLPMAGSSSNFLK